MLRGSTHYCAIAPRTLTRHIVDFMGFRWMETAPTSIEVLLRPTLCQSDEPSYFSVFLSPTTEHRCTHVLVYTCTWWSQAVIHPIIDQARRCLTLVIEPLSICSLSIYSYCFRSIEIYQHSSHKAFV